jgi:hypothetical protein
MEGPAVHLPSLRAPNPYPVSYTTERLNGDPPTGALRPGHYLFGNAMVLLLAHPPPLAVAATPNALQLAPTVLVSVTVRGEVDDPHIHSQVFVYFYRLRCLYFTADRQIELSPHKAQVRFTSLALQPGQRLLTTDIRHPLSSRHCPDADRLLFQLE